MDQRIAVVGRLKAKPGKEEAMAEYFKELSELAKIHEPGMLQHAILRSDSEPGTFIVMELFQDQAAFDYHSKTPHSAEVGRRMGELIDSELGGDVQVVRVVASSS